MTSIPHWAELGQDRGAWDALTLGGEPMPGIPKVRVKIERKFDVQKAKGADGAKLKDQGVEPATVEIEILIWKREDLAQLEKLLPTLRPKRGKEAHPLAIQHPSAAVADVNTIVIETIDIDQPDAKDGWRISIKAREHIAPRQNPGLGKGLGAGGGHCASLVAQLQNVHWQHSSTAAELQEAQAATQQAIAKGVATGPYTAKQKQLSKRLANLEAQMASLESELDKCAGGAGKPLPPSMDPVDASGFGTEEQGLANSQ